MKTLQILIKVPEHQVLSQLLQNDGLNNLVPATTQIRSVRDL